MDRAIGMIELSSIARGIYVTDRMLKAAFVEVYSTTSVCPGKYIAIVRGAVAAVESSVSVGVESAGEYLIDSFVLPHVHQDVFPAITATTMPEDTGALGIIESFAIAPIIMAADAALKAAGIQALELRLGRGIGGKACFTFTGDVADVQAAIDAGKAIVGEKGMLVATEIIPSPAQKLWSSLF